MPSLHRIRHSLRATLAATVIAPLAVACAPAAAPVSAPGPDPVPPPAPWSAAPLAASDVPPEYVQRWSVAENRASCTLIAPATLGSAGAGAVPRAATFSGGWGVAYDLPGTRSAFGVAGTGATPGSSTYDDWPHRITWSDGSRVGYGPEGGTGPQQLAYLQIAGQGCLYNVWSKLGVAHLEQLLQGLRRVRG